MHAAGNAYASGVRECLQASRYVHAIAEDVAAFSDDIADIDADPELDPLVLRYIHVAFGHPALDFDGTTHRVHDARELHQHSIPGGLDDPSTVLGDLRVYEGASMGLELAQSAALISSHQAAVSGYICSEDSREPAFTTFSGHQAPL